MSILSSLYKSPVGQAATDLINPFIRPVVNGLGSFFSNTTRQLPNGAGSYQAPAPAQATAAPAPAPAASATSLFGGAPSASAPAGGAPATGPNIPDNSSGAPNTNSLSPDELAYTANALNKAMTSGGAPDYGKYAADLYSQGPTGPSAEQASETLTGINNTRNDIATGETDPYQWGGGSGVPYTADELTAIQKATAGIYDPALKSATAKLQDAQNRELYSEKYGYDTSLYNRGPNGNNTAVDGTPWKPIYGNEPQQAKLEQQYRDVLDKEFSNRSGGLGLQDAKVNQAIHLQTLLDQATTANGQINLSAPQYEELAIGLANLISGSNAATQSTIDGIQQRTAKGDLNGALTYVLGLPQNASSQAIFKQLQDSISRQGSTSQKLRDTYVKNIQSQAPTDLDPARRMAIEKGQLNNYTDYAPGGSSNPNTKGGGGTDTFQYGGRTYKIQPDGSAKAVDASFKSVGGDTNTQAIVIPPASHLAYVNNNPGNVRYASWMAPLGATPGQGGFARFPSPQAGIQAVSQLTDMRAGQGHTIGSYISLYAPPSENDTAGYIRQVAQATGINPSTPLSSLNAAQKKALIKAIVSKESSTVLT